MSFGLRTWSGAGSAELDTSTFTYQVLFNGLVDFRGSISRKSVTLTIPGYLTSNCSLVILPTSETPGFGSILNCAPWVIPSNGSVLIRNWHPNETNTSRVTTQLLRALAIRFGA